MRRRNGRGTGGAWVEKEVGWRWVYYILPEKIEGVFFHRERVRSAVVMMCCEIDCGVPVGEMCRTGDPGVSRGKAREARIKMDFAEEIHMTVVKAGGDRIVEQNKRAYAFPPVRKGALSFKVACILLRTTPTSRVYAG